MARPRKIKAEDIVKVDGVNPITEEQIIPEGWIIVTEEQVKQAQESGSLVGFDPLTMTALIVKGEQNAA